MKFNRINILVVFVVIGVNAYSQVKFEREYDINSAEVPERAARFIDSLKLDSKLKWYMEESQDGKSIEAKFKLNEYKYSVEFDTAGSIQDVEFIIDEKELDEAILKRMRQQLDERFKKWSFQKIQQQYVGFEADLLKSILSGEKLESVSLSYEIVVKGKNEGVPVLYEISFTGKGELVEQSKIIQKNAVNLEY